MTWPCAARAPYEDKALHDIERFEHETAEWEAGLQLLQAKAATSEMSMFLVAAGLAEWGPPLLKLGYNSILSLKQKLRTQRNSFFGQLEDTVTKAT